MAHNLLAPIRHDTTRSHPIRPLRTKHRDQERETVITATEKHDLSPDHVQSPPHLPPIHLPKRLPLRKHHIPRTNSKLTNPAHHLRPARNIPIRPPNISPLNLQPPLRPDNPPRQRSLLPLPRNGLLNRQRHGRQALRPRSEEMDR